MRIWGPPSRQRVLRVGAYAHASNRCDPLTFHPRCHVYIEASARPIPEKQKSSVKQKLSIQQNSSVEKSLSGNQSPIIKVEETNVLWGKKSKSKVMWTKVLHGIEVIYGMNVLLFWEQMSSIKSMGSKSMGHKNPQVLKPHNFTNSNTHTRRLKLWMHGRLFLSLFLSRRLHTKVVDTKYFRHWPVSPVNVLVIFLKWMDGTIMIRNQNKSP